MRAIAAEQDRQHDRVHRAFEEAVRYGREGRTVLGYALLRQGLASDVSSAEAPGAGALWANALAEFERESPARWYRSLRVPVGNCVEGTARGGR
jgi:hypothetical protein